MDGNFECVAVWLAQADETSHRNKIDSERRQSEMATQLDAFLMQVPSLGYGGFGTDSDWPTSRYEEVWRASVWLSGFTERDSRPKCSSYYLKHAAEKSTGGYLSNGSLIAAAALCDFPLEHSSNSPNAVVGVPIKAARAAYAVAERKAKFSDLLVLEPKLKLLTSKAMDYKRQSKGQDRVCANSRWYGYSEWNGQGLKVRLCKLVGWESSNLILRNDYAYDLAYESIFKMLPCCKNCNCSFPERQP